MTKRNITIAGIALILIVVAVIIIGRSRGQVPSAEAREPVTLNVGAAVVQQADLTRSVQRELTRELTREVGAEAGAVEVVAQVNVLEVSQTAAAVGQLVAQREQGVELTVVLRAAVPRVDQVRVNLV